MTGPWTGYTLPRSPESYEELRDGFEWQIPERYNIAQVALDSDSDSVAIRHVPENGRRTPAESAEAVTDAVRTVTYGELAAASAVLASRLRETGVESGDRVAVCLPQCPELVVAHLAVWRLGGVVVPVSMILGDESFAHVLDHSDAAVLFVDDQRWERTDANVILESASTIPVSVDSGDEPFSGFNSFVSDSSVPTDPPMEPTSPDDPAMILYTSGTTSDPKGVVQGHQYLLGSLPGYHCWFELFDPETARESRVWTPAEWAWAGALFDVVFPTLALGGAVVSSVRREGFDPQKALALVGSQDVTHVFLPPTALGAFRRETTPSASDASSLSVVMCGGESLSPDLASWAESTLSVTVNETYGQTEANALAGECDRVYSGSSDTFGRPYPGRQLAILDEDRRPVPDGESGEIAVGLPDPVVMQEYLDDEDATTEVLGEDYLRTGDVGQFQSDGTIRHLGRKDELLLSSGYRISPLEVEHALMSHPAVSVAIVTGESDPDRGTRVVATVVPTSDVTDETELSETLSSHVADRLGPHKRPRRIDFVTELPTTRTGKTDRSGRGGER